MRDNDSLHIFCSHCGAGWLLPADTELPESYDAFRRDGCEGWGCEHSWQRQAMLVVNPATGATEIVNLSLERIVKAQYAQVVYRLLGDDITAASNWFTLFEDIGEEPEQDFYGHRVQALNGE
jgi:hypothetical protein